jgi:hypothetical protein
MSPSPTTAILVTGMHRSGTSATAGALRLLGVDLGATLLEPGQDNPRGYWENRRAVEIHERLLGQLGRSWYDVRALPEAWVDRPEARQAVRDIEALIADEFAGSTLWAVKDPRMSRLLPIWLEALARSDIRPVVLLVARHPAEVAASIQARNGWSAALSEMLWLRHVIDAEQASRSTGRTAITFDDILADPAGAMSSAIGRLGIKIGAAPAKMRRFIDAKDRHHQQAAFGDGATRLAAISVPAYGALQRIAAGEDAWGEIQTSARKFEAEWSQWGDGVEAVAEVAAKLQDELADAEARASRINSDLQAQVEWGVSAMAKHETLEAERARLQSELTAQLHWSEGAVKKQEATEAERARAQSELTAQLRWAEAAVEKHAATELARSEARTAATLASEQVLALGQKAMELEIALAQTNSSLIAQIRWSEEAVTRQQASDAHRAQLQSDLAAQIQWSEMAVTKHEALDAERARLASELNAQIEWSRLAVDKHEKLEAERARLASDLAAQIEWSKLAVDKHERLEDQRAAVASELAAQIEWSKLAVAKHDELEVERARLQVALTERTRWSEEATLKLETLEAERTRLGSELAAQVGLVEAGAAQQVALQAEIATQESALAASHAAQARTAQELDQSRQAGIELETQRQALIAERASLQSQVSSLGGDLERLQSAHEALSARLDSTLLELAATSDQLGAVLASRWWKLGRPFRAIGRTHSKTGQPPLAATDPTTSSVHDADGTQHDKVQGS